MSEYYRDQTERRDVPENPEIRNPGSVIALRVPPPDGSVDPLPAICSDTLSVGTGSPLPNRLPT